MQTVSEQFHLASQAGIRPHAWGLRISFDKEFDDDIEFFTFDVSVFNGNDLLAPSDDNPIQEWDYYVYQNFDDRVVDMEWSREIDFPYSVQAAMADFTVNNYDGYFTPGNGSPIDGYILPKRPLRMFAGYQNAGILQQFVGITETMPVLDTKSKTASFHALDFLSEMFTMPLTDTVAMANVTTDEVLDVLFQQFGLTPAQYTLAVGRNRIPFVFFEKGKNAGNAFRELMQAEGGNLWIDEQGIIRFEQRLLPVQDPVMTFNDSNTEDVILSGDTEIINTVRIKSDIRSVQDFQPVYTSSDEQGNSTLIEPIIIPASGSKFVPVDLKDPLLSASTPTIGEKTDDSWFTAVNGDVPVGTNVSIGLVDLNNNNYVMLFENSNAFDVQIDKIEVWGEPAKIVDEIRYEAYDEASVEAYGEKVLEIDNNMFGSESNCESFALTILDAYKDFSGVIELNVKSNPALQLGDIIYVDTTEVVGEHKIIKISNSNRYSRASQIIKASSYNPRSWFTFDVSVFDGSDVLAP